MSFRTTPTSTRNYLARHKGVQQRGNALQCSRSWLPKINTEKKYRNPWNANKSVFDYSLALRSLVADMVLYCAIIQMKRTNMFEMRSDSECREIYSELTATAYYKALKGLPSWKPTYDILGFVNSHVNFAWLEFVDKEKAHNDLFNRSVPIPEDWSKDFRESMELADMLFHTGRESEAADIYERVARENPIEV